MPVPASPSPTPHDCTSLRRLRAPQHIAAAALLCWAALGFSPCLAAPRALVLPAGERIALDGRLDESAWSRAPAHERFHQFRPVDRQPAPAAYRTTLQVLAEDDALVIGIRAYDPQPGAIRAPLVRRDRVLRDQDFVAVIVDAVGDRRSAQFLRVNAAGVLADGVYIAEGDVEDFAPDFEFDAAAHRLPDGYSVEVRLPYLALRYPQRGGAPWRLMVARNVPRESGLLLLSAPLTQDAAAFIAELQVIEGLADHEQRLLGRSLLTINPELTLRATRERDGAGVRREERAALGADIKWRPRADWVLDATLNPDFSQVELDAPQLAGNTRFALSEQEKRPFFLESSDVIDLPISAFYSRSVTDPRYGLRATWRGPSAEAAALTLDDRGGGTALVPRAYETGFTTQRPAQVTLLRGRLHGAPASGLGGFSAGALLSLRDEGQGRENRVGGVDVGWRPDDSTQLSLRALASRTRGIGRDGDVADDGTQFGGEAVTFKAVRRGKDWNVNFDAGATSEGFRNDNGFVEQAGVRFLEGEIIRRYGERALAWLGGLPAYEFEHWLWMRRSETTAGETIEQRLHGGLWFNTVRDAESALYLIADRQRVQPGGPLHPTRGIGFELTMTPAPWFNRLHIDAMAGQRVDVDPRADRVGRGSRCLVETRLRGSLAGFGIESEQSFQQGTVSAPSGGTALRDRAARWLGVLHFDARDSLRAVWQSVWVDRAAGGPGSLIAQAEAYRNRSVSIVFQRRFGPGRSLSIGASSQRESGEPNKSELFFKSALWL